LISSYTFKIHYFEQQTCILFGGWVPKYKIEAWLKNVNVFQDPILEQIWLSRVTNYKSIKPR